MFSHCVLTADLREEFRFLGNGVSERTAVLASVTVRGLVRHDLAHHDREFSVHALRPNDCRQLRLYSSYKRGHGCHDWCRVCWLFSGCHGD